MMGYGFDGGGAFGWLGMLGGLVVMIGLVVLVVWVVGAATRGGGTSNDSQGPTALDILRNRYARGEITREEFEQAKHTLGYRS